MSATSIIIKLKREGSAEYLSHVTGLVFGNMVDPSTGIFWSPAHAGNSPWTWTNTGTNDTEFGLMANYKFNGEEKTAFGIVTIDPTVLTGNCVVKVELCTAAIDGDEHNSILRFKSVTVNGLEDSAAADVKDWGAEKPQPKSAFYGISVVA